MSPSYLFGLCLLSLVVLLWVSSSVLTQYTLLDLNFGAPFFLTYLSTSMFLFALPFGWCRTPVSPVSTMPQKTSKGAEEYHGVESEEDMEIGALEVEAENKTLEKTQNKMEDDTQGMEDGSIQMMEEEKTVVEVNREGEAEMNRDNEKLSVEETALLALKFCFIWFLQNLLFNWSLLLTSVSSTTILSSTSSFFTLILSILILRHPCSFIDFGAVLVTIGGVTIIGLQSGTNTSLSGDVLATLSALIYGFYTTLMKANFPDDDKINMLFFFGFIGAFNFLFLWPIFFILHYTGAEVFQLPDVKSLAFLALNALISALSDYFWARSILLTSPIVATVALSLTIPGAMLYDYIFNSAQFSALYFGGSGLIVVGFLLINHSFYFTDYERVVD